MLVKNISGERKTAVMGQLCSVNGIMQKMMMNYYYTRRLQPEGKIDSIVRDDRGWRNTEMEMLLCS